MLTEPTKQAFLTTWPGGYRENWEVYGAKSGVAEVVVVGKCLVPFFNKEHVALEIGCGLGFWTERYLSPHFKQVIALDLLPDPHLKGDNIRYIELPDRSYDLPGVPDASVDFVWSFGVFCHLMLPSIQTYLRAAFRVLKPGGKAALYFSNADRRPGCASTDRAENGIIWCDNNLEKSVAMMKTAGFVNVVDLIPELFDTVLGGAKP